MENEYGILEIEVGPNGEFDEKTTRFILEKVQEAIDEDIWYTEEESEKWFDEKIAKLKNGEFDKEVTKAIIQEVIDEDVWDTHEEILESLDELEMENRNVYNKTFKKI